MVCWERAYFDHREFVRSVLLPVTFRNQQEMEAVLCCEVENLVVCIVGGCMLELEEYILVEVKSQNVLGD